MGSFSSKSKTTQQATTTPTNPEFTSEAVKAQTDAYKNFMARDPQSLVAGPSELQQAAFSQVGNLGGWKPGLDSAMTMAQTAGQGGPNLAEAVRLGPAAQVGQTEIGPMQEAKANSALEFYNQYKNPAEEALWKSTMAEYDKNSDRQRAALASEAAGSEAFGGSRLGVARGVFEGDTASGRALTDAGLRSNAFMQAMGLAGADADRSQSANFFNAGNQNNRTLTQAGFDQQRNLTNTAAQNQFALTQGGMDQQNNMFNAQQQDSALSRQLQAAGLSADIANSIASNGRADIGLTADLGNIQQQIAQAQASAPATQLLTGAQALGATPYNLFTGQNMSGTSTSKTNPGIGGLLGAGLAGWATGGFKL